MAVINCTIHDGLRGHPSGKKERLPEKRGMAFLFTLLFIIQDRVMVREGGGMPGARASAKTRVKSGRV